MEPYAFLTRVKTFASIVLLGLFVGAFSGCGGGGASAGGTGGTGSTGSGSTKVGQTITGTAATGAPLSDATVTIKDTAGNTATGTTAADGTFSIPVTGMTPPFMLVATKTGQQNMYSILPAMDMATTNTKNVNITPVTTLVMYELNLGNDPASMYSSGSFSTVTAANVSAKETIVRSKLPANTVNPIFSMMYGQFSATGAQDSTGYDSVLDGIGKITGITSTSVTFAIAAAYTSGSSTATNAPTISMMLTDTTSPYATRTSISNNSPARVTATVTNANGAPVTGAIVTFTTSDPRDTFLGGTNTALTVNGVASVTLTTSNTSGGASSVTAISTVSGTVVTNSLNYAVGSSTITLSALSLPATALSAYGTASVSVSVLNNGIPYTTPMTVSFTSACAAAGKATLTPSVTTVNGTATASYLDNGCNNASPGDTITATLMNGVTATGNLKVNSPTIGSIQFVSAVTSPATTPVMITLKGTGGTNRSETARVTFRVVDSNGNPLGTLVDFSLNTSLGGLALSASSATSDPVTGNVVTNVLAGTMSTAVRVTATVHGSTLSTQSDLLVVSTGIPAQDAFSLSASTHNIEGGNLDGTPTTLTARLADHFHNPVPDGTAVYFTSEGGSVVPSCTTVGGVCSAVLTSQALRPTNGRVTVLARATGEEAFIDLNSNGVADPGEMIDANGVSTDMGEAYVDYNENGFRDAATEPYIDFNGDGAYNGTTTGVGGVGGTATGDGKYNGVLCNAVATPTFCSTQKSIDVRGSQVIVFSTSEAAISTAPAGPLVLVSCTTSGIVTTLPLPSNVTVTVVDTNGNAMPAGTKIDFSTNNGTIPTPASYTVPDTIGCRTGFGGCPASAASSTFGDISVSLLSNALPGDGIITGCTNLQSSGVFTVTVTSPKGSISTYTMGITD